MKYFVLLSVLFLMLLNPQMAEARLIYQTEHTIVETKKTNLQSFFTFKKKKGPGKSKEVAFILCMILGIFGAHRFYLGYKKMGLLYLCTVGLFCIGWLIDLMRLTSGDLHPKSGFYR